MCLLQWLAPGLQGGHEGDITVELAANDEAGGGADPEKISFMSKEHIKYAHWLVRIFKRIQLLGGAGGSVGGDPTLAPADDVEPSVGGATSNNGNTRKRNSRKKLAAPQLTDREAALADRLLSLVAKTGGELSATLNAQTEQVLWLMHHEY
jgi:hypothetical protein